MLLLLTVLTANHSAKAVLGKRCSPTGCAVTWKPALHHMHRYHPSTPWILSYSAQPTLMQSQHACQLRLLQPSSQPCQAGLTHAMLLAPGCCLWARVVWSTQPALVACRGCDSTCTAGST
jgi:hypothetical protein